MSELSLRIAGEIEVLMLQRGRRKRSELGKVLDLSAPSISRRLNGEISFTVDELETVAAWLDVPVSQLLNAGNPALVREG